MIGKNRAVAARIVSKRRRLAEELGLQQGTLYAKHRAKLDVSFGYMRTGNVRHYVSVHPRKHYVRDRRKEYETE